MKKFILIALVLCMALTFAFAALQAPAAASIAVEPQQTAWEIIVPPPGLPRLPLPNVGWNT